MSPDPSNSDTTDAARPAMSPEDRLRAMVAPAQESPGARMPRPSIGRIVHYVLAERDVDAITRRRTDFLKVKDVREPDGTQCHVGNPVRAGEHVPMIIVVVWPNEYGPNFDGVNGQVLLDGNDSLWVTSAQEGTAPGTWHWPERA